MLHFAVDNTDFNNVTPDGKHEFHRTGEIVIQKQSSSNISSLQKRIKIERSSDASFAFNYNDMLPVKVIMKKPNPPNEGFPNFINFFLFKNVKYQIKQDKIWALIQFFDKELSNNIPTWGAFNSLLNAVPEISICQGLRLYPSPPTD